MFSHAYYTYNLGLLWSRIPLACRLECVTSPCVHVSHNPLLRISSIPDLHNQHNAMMFLAASTLVAYTSGAIQTAVLDILGGYVDLERFGIRQTERYKTLYPVKQVAKDGETDREARTVRGGSISLVQSIEVGHRWHVAFCGRCRGSITAVLNPLDNYDEWKSITSSQERRPRTLGPSDLFHRNADSEASLCFACLQRTDCNPVSAYQSISFHCLCRCPIMLTSYFPKDSHVWTPILRPTLCAERFVL